MTIFVSRSFRFLCHKVSGTDIKERRDRVSAMTESVYGYARPSSVRPAISGKDIMCFANGSSTLMLYEGGLECMPRIPTQRKGTEPRGHDAYTDRLTSGSIVA